MGRLIIAIMYPNDEALQNAKKELIKEFGAIEKESQEYKFIFTKYYEKEFGRDLRKKFLIFQRNIDKKGLSMIRIQTGKIEQKFSVAGKRTVNIDPGCTNKQELVMASLKKAPFKENLGNNVYAHKLLEFNDTITEFPNTFPDYRDKQNQKFFIESQKYI